MDAKILDQVTNATVGKMYFVYNKFIAQNDSKTISNIPFTPLAVIFMRNSGDNELVGVIIKPGTVYPTIRITEWGTNYLTVTNLWNEWTAYDFIILG